VRWAIPCPRESSPKPVAGGWLSGDGLMVLKGSVNENESIVNTPAEALDCFLRTRMGRLVMGIVVVRRSV
jgi:predicted NodU family carbamoyl transferase